MIRVKEESLKLTGIFYTAHCISVRALRAHKNERMCSERECLS